jgi:hypothetical protein
MSIADLAYGKPDEKDLPEPATAHTPKDGPVLRHPPSDGLMNFLHRSRTPNLDWVDFWSLSKKDVEKVDSREVGRCALRELLKMSSHLTIIGNTVFTKSSPRRLSILSSCWFFDTFTNIASR